MTSEEKKNCEDVLGDEYDRIFQNELIYFDEISKWRKLKSFSSGLIAVSFLFLIGSYLTLPLEDLQNIKFYIDLFIGAPIQGTFNLVGFVLLFVSFVIWNFFDNKISKIKNEIGLHQEEQLFLNVFETHKSINSFLEESNAKRKLYFKKLALESAQQMTEISEEWSQGNVRLVTKILGNQINLLKNNIERLILPNIAKGDEATLKKVSNILIIFCKFLHVPTLDELNDLNAQITKLPFEEYQYLTTREKLGKYFANKPRMSRLVFSFIVASIIVVVSYCLSQSIAVISALAVASFWGAFSNFDKIFPPKPK